jgi:predicted alternative tryptophan synthase beta-subunit
MDIPSFEVEIVLSVNRKGYWRLVEEVSVDGTCSLGEYQERSSPPQFTSGDNSYDCSQNSGIRRIIRRYKIGAYYIIVD